MGYNYCFYLSTPIHLINSLIFLQEVAVLYPYLIIMASLTAIFLSFAIGMVHGCFSQFISKFQ